MKKVSKILNLIITGLLWIVGIRLVPRLLTSNDITGICLGIASAIFIIRFTVISLVDKGD